MEKVKISQVKTNDSNPRYIKDHKFKKLVESIKNFPEMLEARPIVVNKEMVVLGGNMRLRACQKAGLKEVFIKVVDWSEKKQQEFIIKDNISFGEWDWDVLANEWNSVELEEWGLDGFPFNEDITDQKDISDQLQLCYKIEIDLDSEEEQEKMYNQLIADGYLCRILTL